MQGGLKVIAFHPNGRRLDEVALISAVPSSSLELELLSEQPAGSLVHMLRMWSAITRRFSD
jgi:hypothetical protein